MPDNFRFDITGVGLADALHIAIYGAPSRKVVGWAEQPTYPDADMVDPEGRAPGRATRRLVLFWGKSTHMTPLPAPMGEEAAVAFVQSWLDAADYGREPDHDGDNKKGCRVYNEAWGHVGHDPYAFVAIEAAWLMYGK